MRATGPRCTAAWLWASLIATGCASELEVEGDVFSTRLTSVDGGRRCAPGAERAQWPVKVVFVVEQSAAMCAADPPGVAPMSVTACGSVASAPRATPRRVQVMLDFLERNAGRENLEVALVTYGLASAAAPFLKASDPSARSRLVPLASELREGAGLASALLEAARLIERDGSAASAVTRSRSRYVVVVLGTGFPSPRCSGNDARSSYASPSNPDTVWADSAPFCNEPTRGPEPLGGLIQGADFNQNSQIFGAVDTIVRTGADFGLGEVKVHSRLVMSDGSLSACGAACRDLFEGYRFAEARGVGRWTAGTIAQRGRGTFVDPGEPEQLSLDGIDTRELATFCE